MVKKAWLFAFIAIFTTAICACAESYNNGGTLSLDSVTDNVSYVPAAAGANTLSISGQLGTPGDVDTKHFKIYGANAGATGASSLTLNWGKSKLFTSGIVQILGGCANSSLTSSALTFNSTSGSDMYTTSGSGQKTILLSGGPEGGTVSGNTSLNITGEMGTDASVYYVKAAAGGLLNEDSEANDIVIEGDSIVVFEAKWGGANSDSSKTDKGGTALLGGPMIQKDGSATGEVQGTAKIIVNGDSVCEMWAAGALLNKGTPTLTVGRTEIELLGGTVDDTVIAGAEVWTKGTATVLGDTNVTVSNITMGGNDGRARIYGGHDVEVDGGKGYVNGNTNIIVYGGKGIKYLFGGGMVWRGTSSATESVVRGSSNIIISGSGGLSALADDAVIFAGGRLYNGSAGSATVENGAFITFKDIENGNFSGSISGQGTNSDYTLDDYTTSVSGDSTLIFDNVSADMSKATIKHIDTLQLAAGKTTVKLGDLSCSGITKISLTGNWAGCGTVTAFTCTVLPSEIEIEDTQATGVIDFGFHEEQLGDGSYAFIVTASETQDFTPISPELPEGTAEEIVEAMPNLEYVDINNEEDVAEAIGGYIASTGNVFTSDDITMNQNTSVVEISSDTALNAARGIFGDNNVGTISALPIFGISSEQINQGDTVAVGFRLSGSAFLAENPTKVNLMKVLSSTSGTLFKYAPSVSEFGDGRFTVLDMNGDILSAAFEAEAQYDLVFFIKDNGEFDLDSNDAEILDPTVLVKASASNNSTSSGGGGCTVGLGAFALLAFAPLVLRRGKK